MARRRIRGTMAVMRERWTTTLVVIAKSTELYVKSSARKLREARDTCSIVTIGTLGNCQSPKRVLSVGDCLHQSRHEQSYDRGSHPTIHLEIPYFRGDV